MLLVLKTVSLISCQDVISTINLLAEFKPKGDEPLVKTAQAIFDKACQLCAKRAENLQSRKHSAENTEMQTSATATSQPAVDAIHDVLDCSQRTDLTTAMENLMDEEDAKQEIAATVADTHDESGSMKAPAAPATSTTHVCDPPTQKVDDGDAVATAANSFAATTKVRACMF